MCNPGKIIISATWDSNHSENHQTSTGPPVTISRYTFYKQWRTENIGALPDPTAPPFHILLAFWKVHQFYAYFKAWRDRIGWIWPGSSLTQFIKFMFIFWNFKVKINVTVLLYLFIFNDAFELNRIQYSNSIQTLNWIFFLWARLIVSYTRQLDYGSGFEILNSLDSA